MTFSSSNLSPELLRDFLAIRDDLDDSVCNALDLADELVPAMNELASEFRTLRQHLLRLNLTLECSFPAGDDPGLPFP